MTLAYIFIIFGILLGLLIVACAISQGLHAPPKPPPLDPDDWPPDDITSRWKLEETDGDREYKYNLEHGVDLNYSDKEEKEEE